MSELAAEHYRWYAKEPGILVPEILDGKPHDLLAERPGASPEELAQQFCETVRPAEEFAVHGIPATHTMLSQAYPAAMWHQMIKLLPRYKQYLPVEVYARRHIVPFADQALNDGAEAIWVEAFARDEVPPRAFKLAANGQLDYVRGEYEPSQAHLLAWAIGSTGCTHAWLTLLQGVYTPPGYRQKSYITPRYSGTAPRSQEVRAMQAVSTPPHTEVS